MNVSEVLSCHWMGSLSILGSSSLKVSLKIVRT